VSQPESIVFLVDVDNTLLDNDRIQEDIKEYLAKGFGQACSDRYWAINERLFHDLGYRDYLGALQEYRVENRRDMRLFEAARYLMDYPFAERLYPRALDVLRQFSTWGTAAVVSDGDVLFQPRKVERAGIAQAVGGNVLIYIHKEEELEDVERRYPARHYVLVDDKLRILTAVKKLWGPRVTTVFPRQGVYAHDPEVLAAYPQPDVVVEAIGELAGRTLDKVLKRQLT
jgi:FMN phosphatase YigB (HAD superfamily)